MFLGRKTFSTNATLGQRGRFNPFIFLSCPCDAGSDAQTLSTRTVYFQMSHHIVFLLKDYTHTETQKHKRKTLFLGTGDRSIHIQTHRVTKNAHTHMETHRQRCTHPCTNVQRKQKQRSLKYPPYPKHPDMKMNITLFQKSTYFNTSFARSRNFANMDI